MNTIALFNTLPGEHEPRRAYGRLRMLSRQATLLCLVLSCFCGCGRDGVGRTQTQMANGITRRASKGPIEVKLTAAPATLEFGRHMRLRLEITADKSVAVLDSEYETALGEGDRRFEYHATRVESETAKPISNDRLRWTYGFDVEFFLPGEYEIPPAKVSFVDLSVPADGQEETPGEIIQGEVQTVETEPLTVTVRAPPGPAMSEAELREITRLDPVELPAVWSRWWLLVPLLAIAVVLTVLILARRLRGSRAEVTVQISPHEWARRRIAELIAEDLITRGRVQEFYYRISAIVRGYIERRFGICAPEMTTEEFLASAADDHRFGGGVTDRLNTFLRACDLVKYARHEATREESEAVLKAAGEFVEQTRRHESMTGEHAA